MLSIIRLELTVSALHQKKEIQTDRLPSGEEVGTVVAPVTNKSAKRSTGKDDGSMRGVKKTRKDNGKALAFE
ncbi:hypothetical protein F443_06585 [Phytophthora nicotianae P1569]|uniref:Uncharacterized protein n=1 Tax=Phytophthora nicotianae P1569 TaxID=1317065 RepID=V9FGS1_PHYNI|nr:hypothetical protein F443_06585 [Phytophthora nicotianae P1569]